MKTASYIIVAFMLFIGFQTTVLAQKSKNIETVNMKVEGVCSMCQQRIQKASFIKGVKSAHWNQESQILSVIFNPKKTSAEQISQSVANVGHATEHHKADKQTYQELPDCCSYKNPNVKSH